MKEKMFTQMGRGLPAHPPRGDSYDWLASPASDWISVSSCWEDCSPPLPLQDTSSLVLRSRVHSISQVCVTSTLVTPSPWQVLLPPHESPLRYLNTLPQSTCNITAVADGSALGALASNRSQGSCRRACRCRHSVAIFEGEQSAPLQFRK